MTPTSRKSPQPNHKTRIAAAFFLAFAAVGAHATYYVVDEDPNPGPQARAQTRMAPNLGLAPTRAPAAREDQYAIPFPKGVTPITRVSREVLDRVLARLGKNPDVQIRIVGRADAMYSTTGEASQMPRKRAINLRGYLTRQGIPMNNITVETDGEPNPSVDGSLYPSYLYITESGASADADTADTGYTVNANRITAPQTSQRYTQPREVAAQPIEAIIEPARRSQYVPPAPVQAPPVANAMPAMASGANRDQLFSYINAAVQSGQLSPVVALQLIRTMMLGEAAQGTQATLQPTPVQAPPAPPEAAPMPKLWMLDKKMTLRENIDNWSRLAGWRPTQWDATNFYQVGVTTTVRGDFPEVLRKVAESTGLNICAKTREKVVRITNSDTPCK